VRQADSVTGRQTDKQADRQTDTQTVVIKILKGKRVKDTRI
jgi:hypothetical protein